jgi:D-alanyl-D-alanine carboxypeptidase (penicillin-binding protein 5/6)
MKKWAALVLAASLLFPTLAHAESKTTSASALTLYSQSAILINPDNGDILFEKNADEKLPPASVTKIMTLTLAAEALKAGTLKKTDTTVVSEKAWKTGGSRMFLEVGRKVSVDDLLKGIAVDSGNDACVALAEMMAGSTDAFIEKMNKKAAELGMKNTIFATVNGLPEGEKSDDMVSARDLGTLTTYYVKNFPEMLAYNKMEEFTYDVGRGKTIQQFNHNPLISNKYEGADGLKTGFITGHFNIVGTAKRQDVRLVAVTLKAETDGKRYSDVKSLLDYGFSQYTSVQKGAQNDVITELRAYKTKTKYVNVSLAADLKALVKVADADKVTEKIDLPSYIKGAKKKGDQIGVKQLLLNNKVVAETPIVVTEDLKKAGFMQRFFDSIAMMFNF